MVAVVFLCRVFQCEGDAVALVWFVINEVGDFQNTAVFAFDALEAGFGVL